MVGRCNLSLVWSSSAIDGQLSCFSRIVVVSVEVVYWFFPYNERLADGNCAGDYTHMYRTGEKSIPASVRGRTRVLSTAAYT